MSLMIKLLYDKAWSKVSPKLIGKLSHRISIDRLPLRLELLSKIAADRKISISVVFHEIIHNSALSSCLWSGNSDNFHLKKEKNKKADYSSAFSKALNFLKALEILCLITS